MAKFYLHILDGDSRTEDLEGSEHEDLASAREEARKSAIDLVCDSLRAGQGLGLQRSIIIADERGRILQKIPFAVATRPSAKC